MKPTIYQDEQGRWWKKYHSRGRRELFRKNCVRCGKDCLLESRSTFCSRKCVLGGKLDGEKNPNWKGGTYIDGSGYIKVWKKGKRVMLHRLIMENILGRRLEPYENVHHKNGIKNDNNPENLELWVRNQPTGARYAETVKHCPTCTCCRQVGEK